MLWIFASLFFLWCALREVRDSRVAPAGFDQPQPIYKPYLALVFALSAGFAWPTVHTWYFQRFLSAKATELADHHRARVHCNTLFDTMLDSQMLAAGHADPKTGQIALQKPWCSTLSAYLSHPRRASHEELDSLDLFTHESMHIRGELNEARTECQAVQRNYRAARLLGVPDATARRNALDIYNINYQLRGKTGGLQGGYYSKECAAGKELDEHLIDSTWAFQ